jgi:hypothetical protein
MISGFHSLDKRSWKARFAPYPAIRRRAAWQGDQASGITALLTAERPNLVRYNEAAPDYCSKTHWRRPSIIARKNIMVSPKPSCPQGAGFYT